MSRRYVIAGGSGFIGQELASCLVARGDEAVVLSRKPGPGQWDARTLGPWTQLLDGCAALINLTGESIAQPWTDEARRKILSSRVESTRVLANALSSMTSPPPYWLNASAVGIYGDRGDEVLTEQSPAGTEPRFLVETCQAWESAFLGDELLGVVRGAIRIGFVLGRDGGALPMLVGLAKKGLGGSAGNGRQFVPWIHVSDLMALMLWMIDQRVEGVVNGAAPAPCTNAEMMSAIRAAVGRPWSPPAPALALRLGGLFGLPDAALVLGSTRAVPARAESEGFAFRFGEIGAAVRDLV